METATPNYLDGIGHLYDRGSYMEVRYDGCQHSTNFMRNGVPFAEAAKWVRQHLSACGVCDFQARVERAMGHA